MPRRSCFQLVRFKYFVIRDDRLAHLNQTSRKRSKNCDVQALKLAALRNDSPALRERLERPERAPRPAASAVQEGRCSRQAAMKVGHRSSPFSRTETMPIKMSSNAAGCRLMAIIFYNGQLTTHH